MPSKRLLIGVALLLVVAAGVVAVRWLTGGPDSRLAAAVALAPKDSQRLTWTDWAAVRAELDADVSASSTPAEVRAFLDDGFEADLTSTSALVSSAPVLQKRYGVSPASLEWELLAQGEEGQVVLMGLPESLDLDELADRLEGLGYVRPDEADGTWQGGSERVAALRGAAPELGFLRIDTERRILMASDAAETLGTDVALRGEDRDDGIATVVDRFEDDPAALSAVVYSGDNACGELAMSQADDADQASAQQLVADAGEVHPLQGFAMAELAGGEVDVLMAFESDEIARTDADTRLTLASGPAPGQGGTFPERFRLGEVTADGPVVRLPLTPRKGEYVLSDLSDGPVLFATC